MLALWPIINPWYWYWEWSTSTLGEVAQQGVAGLGVGGEEEVAGHQLHVILLSQGSMVTNPGSNSRVTGVLSFISHFNLQYVE